MTFDFNYFVDLLNEYCFKPKGDPFKKGNFEFLGERFELFQKIFLSQNNVDLKKDIIYRTSRTVNQFNNEIIIFYLLYNAIYTEYLLTSEDIILIFVDLLDKWKNSFKNQTFPISILVPIDAFYVKDVYTISENLSLRDLASHTKIEKFDEEEMNSSYYFWKFISDDIDNYDFDDFLDLVGTCLVFHTNLSYLYYEKRDQENLQRLVKEFESVELVLKEVINTFHLMGFDFKNKDYEIIYPWWFIKSTKKYQNLKGNFWPANPFNEEDKTKFQDLYQTVNKCILFANEKYRMIMDRYQQIFDRDRFEDKILDIFIIFEWFFTRNMRMELKYRLTLNVALFISLDWEEFKRYNELMKDLYDLRSSIVHGGKWENKAVKLGKKDDIITDLLSILNKCIIKFAELSIEDPNILKKFEDNHFFLEMSSIVKN